MFTSALISGPIGGALVGWSYHRCVVQGRLGDVRWGPLAFGGVFAASLVPFELVGLAFGPFPDFTTAREFLMVVPVGFLGVPVALVLGRYLTRDWRKTWTLVASSTLLHFEMGGSLAFFGGTGAQVILFVGLLVLYTLMGPALAVGVQALGRSGPTRRSTGPSGPDIPG